MGPTCQQEQGSSRSKEAPTFTSKEGEPPCASTPTSRPSTPSVSSARRNQALGKAFGRLSSGFRINTAGDDAAGLGIANKLRADIRSLQQASRNAEQANSLLQVAEGAAQVVQGILERMKELATQSASDNTTADGRVKIQAEFVRPARGDRPGRGHHQVPGADAAEREPGQHARRRDQ